MPDKKMMFGRCFVPDYAFIKLPGHLDSDYVPWILLHEDKVMLEDGVLLDKWKHFTATNEDDVLEEFYQLLESEGYGTVFHHDPVLVLGMS